MWPRLEDAMGPAECRVLLSKCRQVKGALRAWDWKDTGIEEMGLGGKRDLDLREISVFCEREQEMLWANGELPWITASWAN